MFMAAHAYLRVGDAPFTEEQSKDNLELILAAASRLYERYSMLRPLFGRLGADISQSKYSKLIDDRYKEISARALGTDMKSNLQLAHRMKDHPMPDLLPGTAN